MLQEDSKDSNQTPMTVEDRLKRMLEEGKDWERKQTSIEGLFLVRMPQYKNRPPTLAVEINPVDSSGNPTKRKGVVIRSATELEQIARIVSNPKLAELVKTMDKVNPSAGTPAREGVFEI